MESEPEAEAVTDGPAEQVAGDDPDPTNSREHSSLAHREVSTLDEVQGQEDLDHGADGASRGDIEVNTLRGIRDRGGPHEFLTPERLDFDLLVHIESGSARHTVDFTDYALGAGDVLWVHAGQVHHWGAIADIEGSVAMFGPTPWTSAPGNSSGRTWIGHEATGPRPT